MRDCPNGAIGWAHSLGRVQNMFPEWFVNFIEKTRPIEQKLILLILDSHYSHVQNADVIGWPSSVVAREAGCCTKGSGFEFRERHGMSNCPSLASPIAERFCAQNW